MSPRMLVNLILLIAASSGSGCFSKRKKKTRVWKPKQISYGAYDDPSNGKLIAWIPGKASLYEISREIDENKEFFQEHNDQLMMQMQIDRWDPDLEALQKLMQKREYEKIVELIVMAYFVDDNSLADSNWSTRNYWRRKKALFWSKGSRTFSEATLRWILPHVKNDLKSKIFLFAAILDLPRFCEEIPPQSSYSTIHGHADEDCPICFDKMKEGSTVTPCDHKFHTACLSTWADKNGSCPLCRDELPLQPNPFFITAVRANSPKCTKEIMKKMSNFEVGVGMMKFGDEISTEEFPLNALQYVASKDNGDWEEMCQVLLQNGMKSLIEKLPTGTNGEHDYKYTPLMQAIDFSNPKVVKCLLHHGANAHATISLQENYGGEITPLKIAHFQKIKNKSKHLERESEEVYEMLLSSLANDQIENPLQV